MNPSVTVICCTYGRHKWLTEEMFESFLRQDYQNKRLLVINTHPDPILLDREYNNIRIVNEPDRFENLKDKILFAFSLIDTDLWCNFDDDDIFLPWHIRSLVHAWIEEKEEYPKENIVVYHQNMICSEKNRIKSVTQWDMWSCYLYERPIEPFLEYAENCDTYGLDIRLKNWSGWHKVEIKYPELPGYIYRWDTGSRHLSGYGSNWKYGWNECRAEANALKNINPWYPHWDRDYVKDVYDFIQNHQPIEYNGKTQEIPLFLRSR